MSRGVTLNRMFVHTPLMDFLKPIQLLIKSNPQKGYQLYVTLTTEEILLEVEKSSKIIWYYMFTYGSSFTIVAISLAIDPSAYTQADYCVWMEANYLFYFTFVAPVFIYIMVS